MMLLSQRSDKWNFKYPEGKPFEQRFAKISLVPDNQDTSLSGMAMGLLLQIYDAGGYKYFEPEVKFCGISVKGRGIDDPHTDTWDTDTVKILGLLNSDWNSEAMGGGSGLKYAASSIIFLSKKKEKDGTEVIGNIVHCKNHKSRLTIENKMVDVRLSYEKGLDKYYGLLDIAEKYNIFKKVSTRYELPDGTKQYGKSIMSEPDKYFTEDIMKQIEEAVGKEFKYG